MQSFLLKEVQNRQNEVFEHAAVEPVLVTDEAQAKYVIMSAQEYQQLTERLSILEDYILGRCAEAALEQSQMAGSEAFTAALERLAAFDTNGREVS